MHKLLEDKVFIKQANEIDLFYKKTDDKYLIDLLEAFENVINLKPYNENAELNTGIILNNNPVKTLPKSFPSLLSLLGKPQAGKDLVVDYIQSEYKNTTRLTFSWVLFNEINVLLAPYGHYLNMENKNYIPYRKLLQKLGMFRGRQDSGYIGKKLQLKLTGFYKAGYATVFITGARREGDIDFIQKNNGEFWKVIRLNNPYKVNDAVENELDHLEDTFFKHIIINDKNYNDMFNKVDNIIKNYK